MHRSRLQSLMPVMLLATGILVAACSDSTGPNNARLGYYTLTGTPTPATVFDSISQTYYFGNNLTNSIWQRQANMIVSGDYSRSGYWAFAPETATYAVNPDNGTDIHARMVQVASTNTVIYSRSASSDGVGLGTVANIAVASIDTTTGLLTAGQAAVFSDGFSGSCQLTSASATRFLCYDGEGIRRYSTTAGTADLTAVDTIPLSAPLPADAECNPGAPCYGSTFAFDGAYYYFAASQGSFNSLDYIVYDKTGTLVSTYTAAGTGAIDGVYFDWSVGRYSTHDGYGNRAGALEYGDTAGSDTHNFGPVSKQHTLK